jgi:2,4-didehydro-3-deoxy-L-rhamnonate hydrolase
MTSGAGEAPASNWRLREMKLAMIEVGGAARLGAVQGEYILDVSELARQQGLADAPNDLLSVIQEGEPGLEALLRLIDLGGSRPEKPVAARLDEVHFLAPLNPPVGNVIAVGRNYRKHAEEEAQVMGANIAPPTVFTKAITTITGPYDPIPLDFSISNQMDWEIELGVVIGAGGANIAAGRGLSHVFGYTVVNDISARDMQMGWGGQFFKGKSVDYTCPTGPWIVTADEIGDPQTLALRLLVNGVLKQEASTAEMIHSVGELVEWLSVGTTLLPGTLIATGTPDGVGMARTPSEFLADGDVLESQISRIGMLRNSILSANHVSRLQEFTSLGASHGIRNSRAPAG